MPNSTSVTVLAGTTKGLAIYRSDEARTRWEMEPLALGGWKVTAAARDAGGRTYAAITGDIYGVALMVSDDDCKTWRQLEAAPRFPEGVKGNADHTRLIGNSLPFEEVNFDQRHLDQVWRLHVAADGALYAGVSEAGLFVSRDRGESWTAFEALNEHPTRKDWMPGFGGMGLHAILTDPANPERIWAGISAAGLFRSDDGGKSWEMKNEGVNNFGGWCVHGVAHDPAHPNVIYRQDHRGMYRTDDGGDTWVLIENGLPGATLSDDHHCVFGFAMAFDPKTNSAYAIPLQGDNFRHPHEGKLRVFRTRDGGAHWAPCGQGLPDACYANILRGAIALDHADPCGIYFGTTAGQMFASRDGESWQALPGTLPRVLSVTAYRS